MMCQRCGQELEERKHKSLTDKDLKKPFIFSRWFRCSKCKWMKMFEQDKIYNNTSAWAREKSMRNLFGTKEADENDQHLAGIMKEDGRGY